MYNLAVVTAAIPVTKLSLVFSQYHHHCYYHHHFIQFIQHIFLSLSLSYFHLAKKSIFLSISFQFNSPVKFTLFKFIGQPSSPSSSKFNSCFTSPSFFYTMGKYGHAMDNTKNGYLYVWCLSLYWIEYPRQNYQQKEGILSNKQTGISQLSINNIREKWHE